MLKLHLKPQLALFILPTYAETQLSRQGMTEENVRAWLIIQRIVKL